MDLLKYRLKTLLITLLILDCVGVVLVWPIDIAGGAYIGGLFAGQDEPTIPVFRLLADYLMAAVTIMGMIGWLQRTAWGRSVAIFGLGMFCYSSFNSLGWALLSNPILTVPIIFTLVLTVVALPLLLKQGAEVSA
jgi:hypothetical protein